MSGEIYDFTQPFPFSNLELGAPVKKGSGYTIRFSIDDNPIYFQPPKCYLKSGLQSHDSERIKPTANCDLLFGMENEKFLSWAEQLERTVVGRIFDRRAEWFDVETSPEIEDIQSYLQPVGKSYKSGRMYLVRTSYVPADLHVWDEHEREVKHEDLAADSRVVVILELKQLICSATSFQFVFELKQMMLSPERSFNRCLIKKNAADSAPVSNTAPEPAPVLVKKPEPVVAAEPERIKEEVKQQIKLNAEPAVSPELVKEKPKKAKPEVLDVEFNLDELEGVETIALTDPNEVYFKMYKEARRKMKEAKILALSNYLEAKRIKTTYLAEMQIDDTDDSGDEQNNHLDSI